MKLLYLQPKQELRNKTEELERVFTYNYSLTTKKRQLQRELHKRSEEKKRKEKRRRKRKIDREEKM